MSSVYHAKTEALTKEQLAHIINLQTKVSLKKEQELTQLREALKSAIDTIEFYAKATDNPKKYMRQGCEVYNLKKAIFIDGGNIAREFLSTHKSLIEQLTKQEK